MSGPPARAPVSAVVVNFDGREYLDACLAGVAAQGELVDEVIVVDNASRDGSRELVAERHPRARVLALRENRGPCPARNAGLRAARHRWVLLLDNDVVLEPGALAEMLRAAATREDVALVQPRSVLASDPGRVHYDGGSLHYAGLFALRNFYAPLERAEGRGVVAVDGAVSLALLADRDAVLGAGGFDETFFILFEDLDLSLRLRLAGRAILSAEEALVRHDAGTAGISFRAGRYPEPRVFFHSRNRWLHLAKNYRLRTLVACLPALLLYELVWAGFALASGGAGSYARGKLDFARRLPQALRARRRVQAARRASDRELLVGGPLTLTPHLVDGRGASAALRRGLVRGLDRALRLWWRLARPLCG